MCKLYNKLLFVKQSQFLLCEAIFFFFVGNSRLKYRITESIFDTTLFTLTLMRLFTRTYACSAMLLMAAADSCHKNSLLQILSRIFVWLSRKFATSNFAFSDFSRKIVNFSLQTLRKIVRKFNDFSWKIRENKGRISTNFVCITFAILRCLFWHASDTQHATLNKRFGVSQCAQQKPL